MRNEIAKIIKRDRVMELVYGNNPCPKDILGRHPVGNGQVISAYHPDATQMTLIDDRGRRYEMDPVEQLPLLPFIFQTGSCWIIRLICSSPMAIIIYPRIPTVFLP